MTAWWFPDNTVLCNFAAVQRLDVLEKTIAGRGRWTEAVANEADRSTTQLPALRAVFADGWLGDPIEISDPRHIQRVDVIRRAVFGGPASQPRRHLGEAQTLFLLDNEAAYRGSLWVTDDRDAYDYASGRGIRTWDTVDVMRAAVADAVITAPDGFNLLQAMRAADRHLRRLPARAEDLAR